VKVYHRARLRRGRPGATYRLVGAWHDDAQVRAEPFDAVELDLGALWAR
jgi:hypothetical protein